MAFKYPDPEKEPVGVEEALVVVVVEEELVVVVVDEPPDLGRYLIPVEGQLEVDPTGEVGINVPVWTEPLTS